MVSLPFQACPFSPYTLGSIWLGALLAFKKAATPLATSAPLAPHQTTDQEESADTNFMLM
jgi:hypothetical protein